MQVTCNTKAEVIDKLQYHGRQNSWQPEAQCKTT